MTKIWSMEEDQELYYDQLGKITISSEDVNSGKVMLRKNLKVKNLGTFIKDMIVPTYTKRQISVKFNCYDYDPWQAPEFMGYIMAKPDSDSPILGYISYEEYPHIFCLPVYMPQKKQIKVPGYLVVDNYRFVGISGIGFI